MKKQLVLLLFCAAIALSSCHHKEAGDHSSAKVKVTIMYPNSAGKNFDMDYYANTHMPMVAELLGDAMKGFKIDKGVAGRTPDDALPYVAIGYLYFDSVEAYGEAFAPHADKIHGDIPDYTDIMPVIHVSEIVR